MSSIPDREAWITLALTPGIGPARFLALLRAFGSPDGAQAAPFAFLCAVPGISRACATAIKEGAQRRWGAVALEGVEKLGARALLFGEAGYPELLKEIADPPMVLFGWGRTDLLTEPSRAPAAGPERSEGRDLVGARTGTQGLEGPSVAALPQEGSDASSSDHASVRPSAPAPERPSAAAIVGTRHPTQYGVDVTKAAARASAEAGIAVVSGMARGCDAIAHQAALEAGGATIGVLGNGFGVVYPAANRMLYERVRDEGLLLTEFPPGERPHAGSFPRRNRIISGLARATLVVEAGGTSGALLTAGFALDQGRDVLAVPGPITSLASIGTNRLIRDGATPYLGSGDLVGLYPEFRVASSELRGALEDARNSRLATRDSLLSTPDPLLRHVPPDGALLDTIVDASGWPVAQVLDRLLEFELEGRVEQRPGRVFRRMS